MKHVPTAIATAFVITVACSPCLAHDEGGGGSLPFGRAGAEEAKQQSRMSSEEPQETPGAPLGVFEDEPGIAKDSSQNDWRVSVAPWAWLNSFDGDVAVRGLEADVSASFGDILDASDSILAFSGRLEVGRGPWTAFVDGLYTRTGADDQTGPAGQARVDVTFEQFLIDFGLMYRVGEWEPTGSAAQSRHNTSLDVYVGARFNDLKLTLDPANIPGVSGSTDWIDPIVGANVVLPVATRWHLRLNGDVGGFGVNSDLTWSTTAVIGFEFTTFGVPSAVYGGYRAIGHDYAEGSGANRFVWDIIQHGPIVGVGFRF